MYVRSYLAAPHEFERRRVGGRSAACADKS